MPWEQQSPLATFAGVLGSGIAAARKRADDDKERARQEKLDAQQERLAAAQERNYASESNYRTLQGKQIQGELDTAGRASAYEQSVRGAKTPKFKNTGEAVSYYTQRAAEAAVNGDLELSKQFTSIASSLSLADVHESTADFTRGARTDLTKANTGKVKTETDFIREKTKHLGDQLKVARLRATTEERIAGERASNEARRLSNSMAIAQMHEAGANGRAQLGIDAREAIAQQAEYYALTEKMPAEQAARQSVMQYQAQLRSWSAQNAAQQAQDPSAAPLPMPSAPSTTVNIQGMQNPQAGAPTVIMVPLPVQNPDGTHSTIMVPHRVPAPQPASHHAQPHASAPAAHGFDLGAAMHNIDPRPAIMGALGHLFKGK